MTQRHPWGIKPADVNAARYAIGGEGHLIQQKRGMTGIDFADERFIDPDCLEAHRRRELAIDPFSGEHPGIVVATSGQAVGGACAR